MARIGHARVALGVLAIATGWVVLVPARTIRPAAQAVAAPEPKTANVVVTRQPARADATHRQPVAKAQGLSSAAYLAGLEQLGHAFAAEGRDGAWANDAEALLRDTTAAALAAEVAPLALRDDLRVECRESLCRLSVPIPPGRGVESLPVAATLAQALQRAAPALTRVGRVVGERAEPTDPAARRRYVVYWRRG